MASNMEGRRAPQGFRDLLPVWHNMARMLQRAYIALGALATLSSLALAAFSSELSPLGIKVLAFVPAACLGLIAAFDIGSKGNAARGAWRLLNAAVLAYENDATYTIQDLHKQYVAGETLLGDVKFSTSTVRPIPPQ